MLSGPVVALILVGGYLVAMLAGLLGFVVGRYTTLPAPWDVE